ncbi:MAG: FkbM family methyltransferase [candidate division WOR-3 bacterium]
MHILTRISKGELKGLLFYVNPRYEPGYFYGDHEPWVQEIMKKYLKKDDTFYDIGAHKGFFTLLASKLVKENGKVIAFEPDRRNLGILKLNVQQNKLNNVEIIDKAVWSFSGEVIFKKANEYSNWTESKVINEKEIDKSNEIEKIFSISLNDYVFKEKKNPPKFIKIDVEGGEFEVLKGADKVLNAFHPIILCEIHNLKMLDEILSYLKNFKYDVEIFSPVHPRYKDYKQHYILCIFKNENTYYF